MATISSPGIGSGLDVNSIVTQLMTVEKQPLVALQTKQALYEAKLTAIGTLKGSLSSFQTAVQKLSDLSSFQNTTVSPADPSIVTASGSASAIPGTYALEVTQLAKAQKLVAAGQASTSTAIGNGTLTFDFGTISGGTFDSVAGKYTGATFTSNGSGVKTVTIDATNNTLSGIRDAINGAAIGVTASIVNDGSASPNRLVLTDNSTGLSNSIKISVAGDPALSALLAHDPGTAPAGQALSETITAQNAAFKVDGLSVTKTSNTVTDVIQGVTLNLNKTNAGSPTSISVTRDTSSVIGAVGSFVNAYNTINATLAQASAYDPVTKKAAILNGDEAVRTLQSQIRGVLNAPIAGGATTYTVLSQIGVSINKDGTLSVDNSKLTSALSTNFNDVAGLFAAVGKTSDSLIAYTGSTTDTKPGAYAVNVTRLATQSTLVGSAAVAAGPTSGYETGSAAAGLTITAGVNDTLNLTLDGVSNSVTLAPGTYTAASLATQVQTAINGVFVPQVTVSQAGGVITITSNSTGPTSAVNVTGGNGKSNLLGASPTVTNGSQTSITAGVNDTLNVSLDGTSATVTLRPGRYSYASLATEVQSEINGVAAFVAAGSSVSVTQAGGVLTLTSTRYGSGSNVNITGGNGLANLVGGAPTQAAGLDVGGTINGVAATGSGQVLAGATGDASAGLKITVSGGALGARGTVNYSTGYAYQYNQLTTFQLGSDGPLSARTDGINSSIKALTTQQNDLSVRLANTEKRLRAQFNALDSVVASMNRTSSFLSQQFASLSKNSSS